MSIFKCRYKAIQDEERANGAPSIVGSDKRFLRTFSNLLSPNLHLSVLHIQCRNPKRTSSAKLKGKRRELGYSVKTSHNAHKSSLMVIRSLQKKATGSGYQEKPIMYVYSIKHSGGTYITNYAKEASAELEKQLNTWLEMWKARTPLGSEWDARRELEENMLKEQIKRLKGVDT
jgi:hypothetical protein